MPEHPPILSLSLTAYRIETPGDRVCHKILVRYHCMVLYLIFTAYFHLSL